MFLEEDSTPKKFFDWQLVLWLLLSVLGLGVSSYGIFSLINFSHSIDFIEEKPLEASNSAFLSPIQGYLYVDVAGAINKPGIYQLETGSRLADLIRKAGDFTHQADPEYVSQKLNLAQRLKDGDKIYIPSQEEIHYQQDATEFCQDLQSVPDAGQLLVSINTASADELETLEGIGEKRAEEIITNRPYQDISELVGRGVLTESLFEKVKNSLSL